MKQLKMCYLRHEPTEFALPEGYSVKNYSDPSEKTQYLPCYAGDGQTETPLAWFNRCIEGHVDCNPFTDTFFIMRGEEYVAAITAILHPNMEGYVHMVGVSPKYRGKGLAKPLNYIALKSLYDRGAKRVILTTDEFRVAAVRSYLRAGFFPMVNGFGFWNKHNAVRRWSKLLAEFGYKEYEIYTHFGKRLLIKIGG